ncbi:MAG: hypothetical protein ACRD0B_06815, partial [Acidimicrobiales bacterium]
AGAACLGIFVVEPIARLMLSRRRSVLERLPERLWAAPLVGVVQLALAALCTRVAAAGRSPLEAGVAASSGLAICVVLACLLSSRQPGKDSGEVAPAAARSSGAPYTSDVSQR